MPERRSVCVLCVTQLKCMVNQGVVCSVHRDAPCDSDLFWRVCGGVWRSASALRLLSYIAGLNPEPLKKL